MIKKDNNNVMFQLFETLNYVCYLLNQNYFKYFFQMMSRYMTFDKK